MQWKGHNNAIPYYFKTGVPATDTKNIKKQMDIVQFSSCISFREIGSNEHKPDHRLKIQVIFPSDIGFKGGGEVYI